MTLDPMIAQLLELGRAAPPLESLTPTEARAAMRARVAPLAALAPSAGRVEDIVVAGPGGPLAVRIVRPDTEGPHPLVVFFHGGGWVVCDLDTHEPQARRLALGSGAAVALVDYRLAPEARFPAAVEDCEAALRALVADAGRHGFTGQVAVAGDSAGGNLAAVVARRALAAGPALAGQVLIYPVADQPDAAAYPSYAENDAYGLTAANMRWYWEQYLGGSGTSRDPDAVPMAAASLAGLPPALVITAEYDVLRDEGEAYAGALRRAGVETTLSRSPGVNHGFFALGGVVGEADAAMALCCVWLRDRLAAA